MLNNYTINEPFLIESEVLQDQILLTKRKKHRKPVGICVTTRFTCNKYTIKYTNNSYY